MVPRDRVNVVAAASVGIAERLVQRSILNKTCEKKIPKKIHKSEREKHKRDKQNDLFSELRTMLEPDRQNNGEACILGDTARILKDLLSQVESLRKENSALKKGPYHVHMTICVNICTNEIQTLHRQSDGAHARASAPLAFFPIPPPLEPASPFPPPARSPNQSAP